MKKSILMLSMVCLFLSINPFRILGEVQNTTSSLTTQHIKLPAHIQKLSDRIAAINHMDKSSLSTTEKSQLREELKSIRQQLATSDGGIYLSLGSIIIILLLLILIF